MNFVNGKAGVLTEPGLLIKWLILPFLKAFSRWQKDEIKSMG